MIRRKELGAGKIGTIIGLAVLILAIYGLWVYVPTMVKINEFKDFLTDQARYLGSEPGIYEDRIPTSKERILARWKELNLRKAPLTEQELRFEKGPSTNRIIWRMELPIPTVFATFKKKIDYSAEAPFI